MALKISVIIPTYRRPTDLRRCILALANQARPADEVIIVYRDSDAETVAELESLSAIPMKIMTVVVTSPGVVAALNAGLYAAQGDIVVFTDDDAAAKADWIERLHRAYEMHPEAVGVGGRDIVHGEILQPNDLKVGKIQWFGRTIGNHHLGTGGPRNVDMLKGVNMSFRRRAIGKIRFDGRLRGSGAQVHNELAMCLAITRSGGTLLYDPSILVDHYPAQRFDSDQRRSFSALAFRDAAYNETLILLDYLPWYRATIFVMWALSIGTRATPGLVQSPRYDAVHGVRLWKAVIPTVAGRLEALRDHVTKQR